MPMKWTHITNQLISVPTREQAPEEDYTAMDEPKEVTGLWVHYAPVEMILLYLLGG